MAGFLLLQDLQRANDDELDEHVRGLLQPRADPGPDLTSGLGPAAPAPAVAAPIFQALQEHVDQLLQPPTPSDSLTNPVQQAAPAPVPSDTLTNPLPQPAPVAAPEPPAPPAPPAPVVQAEPTPTAPEPPSSIVDQLTSHVHDLTGGALNLVGEGLTNLAQGAQGVQNVIGQGVTALQGQAAPSATAPSAPPPVVAVTREPSLPHTEEPATATDRLNDKWKTQFDFGATYTGSYRTGTPHRGIDIVPHQGGIGTAVEAFHPGTVSMIQRDSGAGGLMVYVVDDAGLTHAYMHLQGTAPGLKVGQRINRGDHIAQMGESGTEGSPHLHYEVRKNAGSGDPLNQLIDPRPYMRGVSGPTAPGGIGRPSAPPGQPEPAVSPIRSSGPQGRIPAEINIPIDQGPSISRAQTRAALAGTALDGYGDAIYDLGERYNVDPAFALSVARNESNYGATPAQTRNNNIFSISNALYGGSPVAGSRWGQYPSKEAGIEAFFKLLTTEYYPKGQTTVGSVMWGPDGSQQHAYAPTFENSTDYPNRLIRTMQGYGSSAEPGVAEAAPQGRAPASGQVLLSARPTDTTQRAASFVAPPSAPAPLNLVGEGLSRLGQVVPDVAGAVGGVVGGAIGSAASGVGGAVRGFTAPGTLPASAQPGPSDTLTNPLGTGNAARAVPAPPQPDLPTIYSGPLPSRAGPAVLPSLDAARAAILQGDPQAALEALGQAGEAAGSTDLGQGAQAVAQEVTRPRLTGVGQALADSPLGQAYQSDLRKELLPNILEPNHPFNVMADLQAKYGSAFPNPEVMTPEDLRRAQEAQLFIGGMAGMSGGLGGRAAGRAGRPSPIDPNTVPRPSKGVDYEALAEMRRQARRAEPGDLPLEQETRLNQLIAMSVNNIFSVPSLVTNTLGGGVETFKRPVVTLGEAGADVLRRDLPGASTHLRAAGADVQAMGAAMGDALADFGSTFRTGIRPSASEAPERGEAFLGKAKGMAAIPFLRAMAATDEFIRHINSAGAQASRMAELIAEHPNQPQYEIIAQFKDDLLKVGEKAAAESVFAEGGTGWGKLFAGERALLTKPGATAAERARGLLTNILVPFSSVPDVILTQGARRLPVLNEVITLGQWKNMSPAQRQRAAVSAVMAEAVNIAIWTQVQQGNISGNGPSNPDVKASLMAARDENGEPLWQPNSVRVAGRWVPYSSLGPVAVRMGAVANVVEQFEEETRKPNPSEDTLLRIARGALNTLQGTGETIGDAWYLQTVGRLFGAMKYGGLPEFAGREAINTIARGVPFSGQLRSIEDVTGQTVTEPPGLFGPAGPLGAIGGGLAARVPGLSQFVPPRIDPATGRPAERPADIGTLTFRSPAPGAPNPVNEILARHNLGAADAPDTITPVTGLTIAITDEEKRQFTELAGPEVEKAVLALSRNETFNRSDPEQQRELLESFIRDAREVAALRLFQTLPREEQIRRLRAYEEAQRRQAEPSVRLP